MPTYEYVCTACENHWEEVQKITEPSLEVCPKCGKSTAKRQISGGNFILKGGGWYADAYSSQPKPKGSSDSKSSSSSSSSSSDTSAAAPAAPAPAKADSGASSGSSGAGGSSGSGSGSGSSTPK